MTREQLHQGQRDANTAAHTVRIPIEQHVKGIDHKVFATHDRRIYVRDWKTSTIRRGIPKLRGKAARRADKVARRQTARPISQKADNGPQPSMDGR